MFPTSPTLVSFSCMSTCMLTTLSMNIGLPASIQIGNHLQIDQTLAKQAMPNGQAVSTNNTQKACWWPQMARRFAELSICMSRACSCTHMTQISLVMVYEWRSAQQARSQAACNQTYRHSILSTPPYGGHMPGRACCNLCWHNSCGAVRLLAHRRHTGLLPPTAPGALDHLSHELSFKPA